MGEKCVYLRWIRSENPPRMSDGGQNIECPAVLGGKQLSMVGQKCICVMQVPGSRFLVNSPNTNL